MDLKRRLAALYVVGEEVSFDDPDGGKPITVWLQKLNTVEKDKVVRKANAQRQAVLTLKKRPQSDGDVKPFVDEVVNNFNERDLMIEFLEAEDINNLRNKKEAEIAASSEWSDESYLEGLVDAWDGQDGEAGLRDVWIHEPDDPEAQRVYNELDRFAKQVEKEMEKPLKRIHDDYLETSDEELSQLLVNKAIEVQADMRWIEVYRRAELVYAVRDPEDHTVRIFDSFEDIGGLQPEVFNDLSAAYRELTVEPAEGKE